MTERVFPSGDWAADDDQATTLGADLAEALLDAISRPDHDWSALDRQAAGLRALTAVMADRYPGGGAGGH